MFEASIPVDLLNPGQVFGCLGFMEAAEILVGDVTAGFDWSKDHPPRFRLRVRGAEDPFGIVLRFLRDATVVALSPMESENDTNSWGVQTIRLLPSEPFVGPDPSSPATLPALLRSSFFDNCNIMVDHWADDTQRDNAKFWAGAGGYPGVALMRDALFLIHEKLMSADWANDPFSMTAMQSSSFRFDWRRDYVPMDIGFSLNNHSNILMVGFPLVEVMAALGLTNARPLRGATKLQYRYGIAAGDGMALLPPSIMRACLGASKLPFPMRTFSMQLGWPGKEGQARAILTVNEEL
jgi:CRISPR-associated protein Csb3